ncbi:MAG TPA: hypothetical protein VHO91_23025, partial [Rhodopila sp.]|nr:hypothetical protein [Rhodopila sp.]
MPGRADALVVDADFAGADLPAAALGAMALPAGAFATPDVTAGRVAADFAGALPAAAILGAAAFFDAKMAGAAARPLAGIAAGAFTAAAV